MERGGREGKSQFTKQVLFLFKCEESLWSFVRVEWECTGYLTAGLAEG